jgi:hypothetical protein
MLRLLEEADTPRKLDGIKAVGEKAAVVLKRVATTTKFMVIIKIE